MKNNFHYKIILQQILEEKRTKNPAFSVGSLGRLLGIPSSRMGQILNGKVGISVKRAIEISVALKLNETQHQVFLLSVMSMHCRNLDDRKKSKKKLDELIKTNENILLNDLSKLSSRQRSIYNYFNLSSRALTLNEICSFFCIDEIIINAELITLIEFNFVKKIDKDYLLSNYQHNEKLQK